MTFWYGSGSGSADRRCFFKAILPVAAAAGPRRGSRTGGRRRLWRGTPPAPQ